MLHFSMKPVHPIRHFFSYVDMMRLSRSAFFLFLGISPVSPGDTARFDLLKAPDLMLLEGKNPTINSHAMEQQKISDEVNYHKAQKITE